MGYRAKDSQCAKRADAKRDAEARGAIERGMPEEASPVNNTAARGKGEVKEGKLSEITGEAQRIIALKEKKGEDAGGEVEAIKNTLFAKFLQNTGLFRREFVGGLQEIAQLVRRQDELREKADKGRVVKGIVLKRMELLCEALIFLERARKSDTANKSRELTRFKSESDEYIFFYVRVSASLIGAADKNNFCLFRLQLIKCLNLVSVVFSKFIPVSFYVLKTMGAYAEMDCKGAPLKPISPDAYKVPDVYTTSLVYKEHILASCLDVLVTHLRINSTSVSFPEFAGFIVTELRKVRSLCSGPSSQWAREKIDNVVARTNAHVDYVIGLRGGLCVVDEEKIQTAESDMKMLSME